MVVGLMSCTNEILDPDRGDAQNEGVPMSFNVTVLGTRAAISEWVDGDKIYVFFKGLETKYLVLTYNGSTWANESAGGTFYSTDFDGLGEMTLTAVHFPQAVNVTVNYANGQFSFASEGKSVYNYYLYETDKTYSVDGNRVTASLLMCKPADMVLIHVAGIQDQVADYTFGCSKIRPVACKSVGTDGTLDEDVLQAGARLSGFSDADGGIFAGRLVYPGVGKNYKFTLASDDCIYTLTRAGKALTAGNMYNFPSLSETGGDNWVVQNASDLYVDLDITVGGKKIYWVKCNLGAANPQSYGDYFAWGETTGYNEGKKNYAWNYYYWGTAENALTKYCNNSSYGKDGFTDALTTLEKEDDAAYSALGGKFRMPTDDEWTALRNTKGNTTDYDWIWCDGATVQYEGTKVRGWKIVLKSTGATLFLPAAGGRYNANPYDAGTNGYYWSSSLSTDNPTLAPYVDLASEAVHRVRSGRFYGFSVRPVSE